MQQRPWASYAEYLASDVWQRKRQLVWARATIETGGDCERCLLRPGRDCHHTCYRWPWGDEPIESLILLCRECHDRVTEVNRQSKELGRLLQEHERTYRRLRLKWRGW